MRLLKFKFKFEFLNDIDDINDINVFINHSVKILTRNMNTNTTKPLEKDKNDKNVFVNNFDKVVKLSSLRANCF